MSKYKIHLAELIATAFALSFALWLDLFRLAVLPAPRQNLDEGLYLSVARLLNFGYPYDLFYFDQPPFFSTLLSWALQIGGDSLLTGRLLIVAFSIGALLALAWLTRSLYTKWAVPFALVLIATDFYFLEDSRRVMGEIPCLFFLLTSLIALAQYSSTERRARLLVSGTLFALALAIKPIAFGYGITFIICLATDTMRPPSRARRILRQRVADIIWFSMSGSRVLIPTLRLDQAERFWREVIAFHLAEDQYYADQPYAHWQGFVNAVRGNLLVVALAVPGVLTAARKNLALTCALEIGMLATLVVLIVLPPFPHHYTLLIPFLGLFSGIGIAKGIQTFRNFGNFGRLQSRARLLYLGLLVAALLVGSLKVPGLIGQERELLGKSEDTSLARVEFVKQYVASGEFVMSDDPILAYLSGGLLPPCGINFGLVVDVLVVPNSTQRFGECMDATKVQTIISIGGYGRVPPLADWLSVHYPTTIYSAGLVLYRRE